MKLKKTSNQLKELLIIKKSALATLEPRENALNENIKYWLKNNELIQLKKGSYIFRERWERETQKDQYLEYLACALVAPAYLSGEYVLGKYQILSEPVQALTLITPKSTRKIKNKIASFRYYSIADKLFFGFKTKYFQDAPYFEAEKEKAFFDYIYLRFIRNAGDIEENLENLRLNWEGLSKKEFKKISEYAELVSNQKIKKVFKIIKRKYYA